MYYTRVEFRDGAQVRFAQGEYVIHQIEFNTPRPWRALGQLQRLDAVEKAIRNHIPSDPLSISGLEHMLVVSSGSDRSLSPTHDPEDERFPAPDTRRRSLRLSRSRT